MSILNVVSSQTGCARLCMPSAPLSLCSWSVNGLSLLPPLFSPLPTLSLTKRRDLHNMHAVEAYIVQKTPHLLHCRSWKRCRFNISKQRAKLSLPWALKSVAPDCRISWNRPIYLWSDGQTTCVSSRVISFWSCYSITCLKSRAPLKSWGQQEVKLVIQDRKQTSKHT